MQAPSPQWLEEPYYEVAWSELSIRSDQLSKRLQVDPLRVQHALEVSAIDWNGNPFPRPFDGHDPLEYGLAFAPPIEEAVALIGPERALQAFEEEDCRDLARSCELFAYLQDALTPFLTTLELAELYSSFVRYLKANEASLIRTGYPDAPFSNSQWLDCYFTTLMPTKAPLDLYAGAGGEMLTPTRDGRYHPLWTKTSSTREWQPWGPLMGLDWPESIETCGFDEAEPFPWLGREDAEYVDSKREKLLQAKIELFGLGSSLLRAGRTEQVWSQGLEIVTETFDGDEADALIDVDARNDAHRKVDIPWLAYKVLAPEPVGGFKELFTILGIVEKELWLGTFGQPRERMIEADPELTHFDSYFQLLDHPNRQELDQTLSLFLQLQPREHLFWNNLKSRVAEAFERDFYRTVAVSAKVRGRHVEVFTPYVQSFVDFQAEHLKRTGQIAPLQHVQPQSSAPTVGVWHTSDYRKICWEDEWRELSTNQARVVELLDSAHSAGSPALSQASILEQLDIRSSNLYQVFRASWAWKTLIVSRGRGLYGLNSPQNH